MSRKIKFRAWSNEHNRYCDLIKMDEDDRWYGYIYSCAVYLSTKDIVLEQYTGLKDKNGDKEIYEYDIIDGEGNIIGNYHETPELLKDRTNLLIQGFGTKTWLTTYQEAVERGCHDA